MLANSPQLLNFVLITNRITDGDFSKSALITSSRLIFTNDVSYYLFFSPMIYVGQSFECIWVQQYLHLL